MTDLTPQQQAQKTREQAAKDLQDIAILKRSEEFRRYYLRRLGEKEKAVADSFRRDKVTHEERETLRRILDLFEELGRMMAEDEAANGRVLQQ